MSDFIIFNGTKDTIIKQLTKYMDRKDAKKFFENYFQKTKSVNNQVFIKKSLSKINQQIAMEKFVANRITSCYKLNTLRSSNKKKDLYSKTNRIRTLKEIDSSTITIGTKHTNEQYLKVFSKIAFIAAVVALDITLVCTLSYPAISTVMTAASLVKGSIQIVSPKVSTCIISIVKEKEKLPKYSSFVKSNCKNMSLECNYISQGKCKISQAEFVNVVNELLNKKILIIKD